MERSIFSWDVPVNPERRKQMRRDRFHSQYPGRGNVTDEEIDRWYEQDEEGHDCQFEHISIFEGNIMWDDINKVGYVSGECDVCGRKVDVELEPMRMSDALTGDHVG